MDDEIRNRRIPGSKELVTNKQFSQWWSCLRKITYSTRRRAKRAVRHLNQKFHANKKVYRCRFCDYFHIGQLKNGRPAENIGEETNRAKA